jgi:hypothetical protein
MVTKRRIARSTGSKQRAAQSPPPRHGRALPLARAPRRPLLLLLLLLAALLLLLLLRVLVKLQQELPLPVGQVPRTDHPGV